MDFEEFWADIGQRTLAFDARGFALAGWKGHQIHGTNGLAEEPLADEQKLLKDKENE